MYEGTIPFWQRLHSLGESEYEMRLRLRNLSGTLALMARVLITMPWTSLYVIHKLIHKVKL